MKNEVHYFDHPHADEVLIGIWPKGHDAMAFAIRGLTHGYGEHACFIRGNGLIVENFWPHVRERQWQPWEHKQVELYRIAGSTPDDWWNLEKWFDEQLRNPPEYSVVDLFRYAVNLPPVHGSSCFCSMWVLRGLRLNLSPCKQPLARLPYQDWASPRDLRISPLLIKQRK